MRPRMRAPLWNGASSSGGEASLPHLGSPVVLSTVFRFVIMQVDHPAVKYVGCYRYEESFGEDRKCVP